MNDTREQLERAYRYIKHDHTAEAQQILRSLLDEDSGNVHAWWLLAHAQTDVDEIRHALNRVVALDPDYPNAHKARAMLATLDSHFPTPADLDALVFLADDSLAPHEEGAFVEGMFTPLAPGHESFDERPVPELDAVYFADDEDARISELAASEDPFHALEEDLLSAGSEGSEELDVDSADLLLALADDDVDLEALLQLEDSSDDEELAPGTTRRRARRRRPWAVLALVAVVAAIVALWGLFLRDDDSAQGDPGPPRVLPVEDVAVASLLQTLNAQLEVAGLGPDYRAVVANSGLGRTLYVEFCTEPGLALPHTVAQGMELVARQAASAEGLVNAVGVWVNRCQADPHDTLFRAEVGLETAQRYVNGDLGAGEVGLASFQALWTKS